MFNINIQMFYVIITNGFCAAELCTTTQSLGSTGEIPGSIFDTECHLLLCDPLQAWSVFIFCSATYFFICKSFNVSYLYGVIYDLLLLMPSSAFIPSPAPPFLSLAFSLSVPWSHICPCVCFVCLCWISCWHFYVSACLCATAFLWAHNCIRSVQRCVLVCIYPPKAWLQMALKQWTISLTLSLFSPIQLAADQTKREKLCTCTRGPANHHTYTHIRKYSCCNAPK